MDLVSPANLVYLDLSGLRIHRLILHPAFASLVNLRVFIARDAYITSLDRSPILLLPSLQLLDLRHNLLLALPAAVANLSSTLQVLRLAGNYFVPPHHNLLHNVLDPSPAVAASVPSFPYQPTIAPPDSLARSSAPLPLPPPPPNARRQPHSPQNSSPQHPSPTANNPDSPGGSRPLSAMSSTSTSFPSSRSLYTLVKKFSLGSRSRNSKHSPPLQSAPPAPLFQKQHSPATSPSSNHAQPRDNRNKLSTAPNSQNNSPTQQLSLLHQSASSSSNSSHDNFFLVPSVSICHLARDSPDLLLSSLILPTDPAPDQMRTLMAYFRDLYDLKYHPSHRAASARRLRQNNNNVSSSRASTPTRRFARKGSFSSLNHNPSASWRNSASTDLYHSGPSNYNHNSSSRAPSYYEELADSVSGLSHRPSTAKLLEAAKSTSVKDDWKTRARKVLELVDTERKYLGYLQRLSSHYLRPAAAPISTNRVTSSVKDKETIVPFAERKAVFSNIESIITFHETALLPDFERAEALLHPLDLPNPPSEQVYAHLSAEELERQRSDMATRAAQSIAQTFINHAAYFKLYHQYITTNDAAQKRLAAWTTSPSNPASYATTPVASPSLNSSQNMSTYFNSDESSTLTSSQRKRIAKFLNERYKQDPSQINLGSYLLMPVQRVPRYKLLLEGLYQCTPEFTTSSMSSQLANNNASRTSVVSNSSFFLPPINSNNIKKVSHASSESTSRPATFSTVINDWNNANVATNVTTASDASTLRAGGSAGNTAMAITTDNVATSTPAASILSTIDSADKESVSESLHNNAAASDQSQTTVARSFVDASDRDVESIYDDYAPYASNNRNSNYHNSSSSSNEARPPSSWSQSPSFSSSSNGGGIGDYSSVSFIKSAKSTPDLLNNGKSNSNGNAPPPPPPKTPSAASMHEARSSNTPTNGHQHHYYQRNNNNNTNGNHSNRQSTATSALNGAGGSDMFSLSEDPQPDHSAPLPKMGDRLILEALHCVSAITMELNERKRSQELTKRLVEWQGKIGLKGYKSPLVQPHRYLIKDGEMALKRGFKRKTQYINLEKLNVIANDGETGIRNRFKLSHDPQVVDQIDVKHQDYRRLDVLEHIQDNVQLTALLCNDLLILLREKESRQTPTTPTTSNHNNDDRLELYTVIRLANFTIDSPPASLYGMKNNMIRLVDSRAILYLQTDQPESWVTSINGAVLAISNS